MLRSARSHSPPTIVGALTAIVCFVMIDYLEPAMGPNPATGLALVVTLFIVMLFVKIPALSATLPFFNAYSCYFIGFAAKTYLVIDGMPPCLNALIWITGANILGLFVGWVTIETQKAFDKIL